MLKPTEVQRQLTPKEKLRNLIEGLCEEPFEFDSAEGTDFDYHLVETKQSLVYFAETFAKEHGLIQEENDSQSSTGTSASTDKDKKHPDAPPTSRKM